MFQNHLRQIHNQLKTNSRLYWFCRGKYVELLSNLYRLKDSPSKSKKPRVLFYHINGLGHSGTEKFLQILAKHLNKDLYEVYYLYPDKIKENPGYLSRYKYLEAGGVKLIPFTFLSASPQPPHFIFGMNPDIKNTIAGLGIDTFVTAGAGSPDYPFSVIKKTPIVFLNIFGQPNIQKNISCHVCISKEVATKISNVIPRDKISIYPVPSEGPTSSAISKGRGIRSKFNIPDEDIVFGRIGRDDNNIHDNIGIEAFKLALRTVPNMHYLIMSPPSILVEKVKAEKIPNVHFLAPSSEEEDIWAFHASIDVLAHFRKDGESFGLNIAESMLSGNPIITHKSHIWNAHLEYLDGSFARVAEKDDIKSYASFLVEFANLKKENKLIILGGKAQFKGTELFLIKNIIKTFEQIIQTSLNR